MRRRDLRSDTHRDGIEACRRFWLGSHVAQRSGRVALRVSDVRWSPPITTVETEDSARDFGRSQHSLFGRKLHPHTVFSFRHLTYNHTSGRLKVVYLAQSGFTI